MSAGTRALASVELLESRRFLSVATEIGLIDAPMRTMDASNTGRGGTPAVTLPNIKRTYSGTFALAAGLTGTFKLYVRKEEIRTDYAALRGTLYIDTNQGNFVSEMTYGKLRSNLHVNMTLVSTVPAVTVTVTGKTNSTGSQMKGNIDVTGATTFSTTFIISKVVHS